MIENGADLLSEHTGVTTFLWAFSAWMGDPAVLTAIASLLTAIAAFCRSRHRRTAEPAPRAERPPLSRPYETVLEIEEKIREELLAQLQNLQEEAELINQDLATYQLANTTLRGMIINCSERYCRARASLLAER